MGFLSKLFGNKDPFDDGKDQIEKEEKTRFTEDSSSRDRFPSASTSSTDSSWPQKPPAEENQYNFNGSYVDYFLHVFREDFSDYTLRVEKIRYDSATLIYFLKNDREELCVELMSRTCSVQKIRRECRQKGLRYLRFYYNHKPWWNTRRYVTERVSAALNTPSEVFWRNR